MYFILRKYNDKFEYEPKYNGGYNPECSFLHENKTVNIEVKCPNMEKRVDAENRNTLKIFAAERIPEYDKNLSELTKIITPNIEKGHFSGIEVNARVDNKLKDYLISGQKKFPVSDDNNFNILVIALEIIPDLDELYSYIFGSNGVFTKNTFVKDSYDNIDAILLSTPVCGHKAWTKYMDVNVWNLEETLNFLLLDPNKEHSETGKYYMSYGIHLFGNLSKNFLDFQQKLDIKFHEKWNGYSGIFEDRYIDFKLTDFQIITEFIECLKNNCNLPE